MVQTFIRRNPLCYSYATEMRNRTSVQKTYFNQDYSHECSTLKIFDNVTEIDYFQNFDERAKLIDWYSVDNLYTENQIYSKFKDLDKSGTLRPELEKISKDKLALLFYNNYPGLNLTCIKHFKDTSKDREDKHNDNTKTNEEMIPFELKHLSDIQKVQAFLFCEFLSIMFNGVFIVIEIIVFKDNWFRAAENKDPLIELKYILTNYTYLKMSVFVGYFCFAAG